MTPSPRHRPRLRRRPPRPFCAEPLEGRTLLASTLINLPFRRDLVFDPGRDVLHITTDDGRIQRYDLATGSLLAPLSFGGSFTGADLSPDGQFLWTGEIGSAARSGGALLKIHLDTGTPTRLPYAGPTPASDELGPWDIAIGANGRAIYTTLSARVDGVTQLRGIDTNSGTPFAPSTPLNGFVDQGGLLDRSADRGRVFFHGGPRSSDLYTYDPAANTFPNFNWTSAPVANGAAAVSPDGSVVAIECGSFVSILDGANLRVLRNLGGLDGGMIFSADGRHLYAASSASDEVVAFDTTTWQEKFRLPVGQDVTPSQPLGNGVMAVSDDGSTLFLSVTGGIRKVDLPRETDAPVPTRITLTGFPSVLPAGAPGTFTVTVLDQFGNVNTGYRGAISFTSTDPGAALPGAYIFTAADNGSHTFTARFQTPGENHTIRAAATPPPGLFASHAPFAVYAAPLATIPINNYRDIVFDSARNRLYATTNSGVAGGTVERFDFATGTLLEPLRFPVPLNGLDIRGDKLYAAEAARGPTGGLVREIDLVTGESRPLLYDFQWHESDLGTFDVAATANGKLLVEPDDSQWHDVRVMDLATGTTRTIAANPGPWGRSMFSRSADGGTVLLNNASHSMVAVYHSEADAFLPEGQFPSDTRTVSAVSRDGRLMAATTADGFLTVFDRDMGPVRLLRQNLGGGVAFDLSGDVLYAVDPASDQVVAFDTYTWETKFRAPLAVDVGSPQIMGTGNLLATGDGRVLLTVAGGVAVVRLPPSDGSVASVRLRGLPPFLRAGTPGAFTVSVRDPAGNLVRDFAGTVRFTSTDPAAALPAPHTFTPADGGTKSFTATFAAPGSHTITASVDDTAFAGSHAPITVHAGAPAGAPLFVPVASPQDLVLDPTRGALYVTTAGGTVEHYDIAGQSLLTPLDLSGAPVFGADITPDGSALYVARGYNAPRGVTHQKVTLGAAGPAGGTVSSLPVYRQYGRGWDVAVAANGLAFLVGTAQQSSVNGQVQQVDTATGVITTRGDFPGSGVFADNTYFVAGADRSLLLLVEGGLDSFSFYESATDQPSPRVRTAQPTTASTLAAVDRTGTLFAIEQGNGTNIYDRRSPGVWTLNDADGGMAFDPLRSLIYAAYSAADRIDAYDTDTHTLRYSFPAGFDVQPSRGFNNTTATDSGGSGRMEVSADGRRLFLTRPDGVMVYDLAGPGGAPTADAGAPRVVAEGQSVRLDGRRSSAAPPNTIVRYEWDFDYDGTTFDVDATGERPVLFEPDFDGPGQRTVAVRVIDSAGGSAVDTTTLQFTNTPPTLDINGPAGATAGQPYVLSLSAIDPGPETLVWTIDWGDGTTSTAPATATSISHTYADGTHYQTIRATATDEDGTYPAENHRILVTGVNDDPVINEASVSLDRTTVTESDGFVTITGQFFDADTADDHPVRVDWGDGTVTVTNPPIPFGWDIFVVSHRYVDDPAGPETETYAIRLTVLDTAGGSDTMTLPVTVRNNPPAANAGADRSGREGQSFLYSASGGDVAADQLTFRWVATRADGSVAAEANVAQFVFRPDDDGVYTVAITVTDDDGGSHTDTATLRVADVPPAFTVNAPAAAEEGRPYNITLSATDPGTDPITQWVIDWGDGSTETLPGTATSASHVYADGPADGHVAIRATTDDGTFYATAAHGPLDPTFGTGGTAGGTSRPLHRSALQPDGKVVSVHGAHPTELIPWRVVRFNADGSPDLSFGTNGATSAGAPPGSYTQAVALQGDGKIVAAGFYHDTAAGAFKPLLVRYNADGTVDTTFGTAGVVRAAFGTGQINQFRVVTVLPDGKILAAGVVHTAPAPYEDLFAARFNADGSVDTTFGTDGRTPSVDFGGRRDQVTSLLVLPDGRFVVAGADDSYTSSVGGQFQSRAALARFTAGGQLDTTFGNNGKVTTVALPGTGVSWIAALAAGPGGTVVAAGGTNAPLPAGGQDFAVFRYRENGTLDPSFDNDGVATASFGRYDWADTLVVEPDGHVLAGGFTEGVTTGAFPRGFALARFTPSGAPDMSYGTAGRFSHAISVVGTNVRNLFPLPDGKLLAVGYGGMARYQAGGAPVAVANVAPTAAFGPADAPAAQRPTPFRFSNAADPSPTDAASGFLYSFDFNNDGDFADPGEAENVTTPERAATHSPGTHSVRGRIADKDGGFTDYVVEVSVAAPGVVGRHVFYDNSFFDGGRLGAPAADDNAIASDKRALLPGQTATFANVTNYSRGVNGIMIDVAGGLPMTALAGLAAGITFKSGRAVDPANWADAPGPSLVGIRPGAGAGGSDRITLTWGGNAVRNAWLRVFVPALPQFGIASSDVFYVGNLVAETGSGPGAWRVDAVDVALTRAGNSARRVGVTSRLDHNRDGRVNTVDLALARQAVFSSLPVLAAPASAAAAGRLADEVLTTDRRAPGRRSAY